MKINIIIPALEKLIIQVEVISDGNVLNGKLSVLQIKGINKIIVSSPIVKIVVNITFHLRNSSIDKLHLICQNLITVICYGYLT